MYRVQVCVHFQTSVGKSVCHAGQSGTERGNDINGSKLIGRFGLGHRQFMQVFDQLAQLLDLSLQRRSEEHTSELQSLMRISYAVFCLKKKNNQLTRRKCNTYTNVVNS